jgi:hypothetical protein
LMFLFFLAKYEQPIVSHSQINWIAPNLGREGQSLRKRERELQRGRESQTEPETVRDC